MKQEVKAGSRNPYDAIIVGSGISGGWAAKELCEKGLKVLLLERGQPVEHPNYPNATQDPWDFPHRGRLTQADRERCQVQSRHFSYNADNKDWYINDLENPYHEVKRYDWIRVNVVGGRSLVWGRQCYRWSDLDFEANAREGIAIDWPIRYRDLAPWYDYVESYIGVSGQAEQLPQLPDGKFLPPMDMTCVEQAFKHSVEKKYPDRRVTIGRVANLTAPVQGRGVCQFRNQCHRGCPYGAYFSTNASTLPAAFATGNLTLRPHSLVNRVLYDERKQVAAGVEVIDTETGDVLEFYSRLLFLNTSTVATTFILLNSTSTRFENGLGNDSDQVGRNLMDHHKCQGLNASVAGFEDQYYFGRRANGIYIPRFRNIGEQRTDYRRGFNYQGWSGRGGWGSLVVDDAIGETLKDQVTTPGGWGIGFTAYGECLPYADNRITLNTDLKDKYGRNTVSIDAAFRDNELAMQQDMKTSMGEMLEAAGFRDIKLEARMAFPGNANHEMGTARMGKDPRTSVLNAYNQMHAVKNVFITDGSCMTSSSCVNPSLTYMALTARACDYAMREMNKLNI